MIKNKRFLWFLLLVIALLVTMEILIPKPLNWSPTLGSNDKIPYGTYLFQQELQRRFSLDPPVVHETFYEICNRDTPPRAILSLSNSLATDSLDAHSILQFVGEGGMAFLCASNFHGLLGDSLNLETNSTVWMGGMDLSQMLAADTTWLHYVNPGLAPAQAYRYKLPVVYAHFSSFDTLKSQVVAVNEENAPVMIKVPHGSGFFLLCTTPLAFSNYYMLQSPNHEFAAKALSYLDLNSLVRTEYYQQGRKGAQTPMRFIVSDPALRWSYLVAIFGLVLFVFFEARRRQRVIPVVPPLKNTTLDFTNTVGRLYFEQADHKNIAQKMVNYLLEDIRSGYYMSTSNLDENFIHQLSKKSGVVEPRVKELFNLIGSLSTQPEISKEQLMTLNNQIDGFRNGPVLNTE